MSAFPDSVAYPGVAFIGIVTRRCCLGTMRRDQNLRYQQLKLETAMSGRRDRNNLSGDFHANATSVRNSGNEKKLK